MKKLIILLLVMCICAWSLPSWGETIDNLRERLEQNNKSVDKNLNKLNQVKGQKKSTLKQIQSLDKQIDDAQESINKLYKQISNLDLSIEQKEEYIQKAEEKIKKLDELLEARIVALYKNGQATYLEILLDSKSVSEFYSRYQVVEDILKYDKELLNETTKNKQALEQAKLNLEKQKEQREQAKSAKIETKKKLDTYRGNKNYYLRNLTYQQKELEAAIDQLLEQSEAIEQEIKNIQQKSNKAYTGGSFCWPVIGPCRISSEFGYRTHPVLKKKKMHTGIDIARQQGGSSMRGRSIVAANSGTVIFSGWNGGYGKAIIIDHGGGKSTLYAHADKLLVSKGKEVKKGQVIAKVGSTGMSTGPHLHFEVRENGKPVDPLKYVSK